MKVFAKIIPILALAIPAAGVPIPGSARQIVSVSGSRSDGSRAPQAQKGKTCIYEGKQRWLDVHPRADSWQWLWRPRDWSLGSL